MLSCATPRLPAAVAAAPAASAYGNGTLGSRNVRCKGGEISRTKPFRFEPPQDPRTPLSSGAGLRVRRQLREQPRVAATPADDVETGPSSHGSSDRSKDSSRGSTAGSRPKGQDGRENRGGLGGRDYASRSGEAELIGDGASRGEELGRPDGLYATQYDAVLAEVDALPAADPAKFKRVLHALSRKYPRRHVSMGSVASQNLLVLMHLSAGALTDKQLGTIFHRNPSLFQTDFNSLAGPKTALFKEYGISPVSLLRAATRACIFSVSEETLSAALHYLRHDLGVKRIDKVVQSFPFVLNLTVPTLREKVRQLELAGLSPVADILETSPFVLGGRASEIQRKVLLIQSILGDKDGDILYYLRRYPQLLLVKHETTEGTFHGMVGYFGEEQARRLLLRQPLLLGQNWDSMVVTLTNLISMFGREGAVRMMNQMPLVIAFSWETLEGKIRFVVEDMGRGLADVALWPALLTRSVEKRLRPRYKVLLEAGKAHKYGLGYMFGCSDVDFERRFGLTLPKNRGEEKEEEEEAEERQGDEEEEEVEGEEEKGEEGKVGVVASDKQLGNDDQQQGLSTTEQ